MNDPTGKGDASSPGKRSIYDLIFVFLTVNLNHFFFAFPHNPPCSMTPHEIQEHINNPFILIQDIEFDTKPRGEGKMQVELRLPK